MQLTKNQSSPPSTIRSLVCDHNGIIIAETVYRCMICATIFDHLAEIQAHYQCEHLETIATDDKNFESNDIIDYENDDFDDDDDDGEEEEEEILDNSSLSASYDQLNCNFSIDYGVELNSEPDDVTENDPISFLARPAEPTTKGGFLTCEVCGLTKFYSHISRRYGIFSCESCAKFYYRYSQKPVQYSCPNNGNCSLKIDLPGARCKSCLLEACLKKFIVNPKKNPKLADKNGKSMVVDVPVELADTNDSDGSSNQRLVPKLSLKNPKYSNSLLLANSSSISSGDSEEKLAKVIAEMPTSSLKSKSILTPKKKKHNNNSSDELNKKIRLSRCRRAACRMCEGCLADDCGKCLYCLDKPKFGGNDIKKQKCLRRRCILLK